MAERVVDIRDARYRRMRRKAEDVPKGPKQRLLRSIAAKYGAALRLERQYEKLRKKKEPKKG